MDQGIAFQGMQTRAEGARIVGKVGFSNHPMLEHFKFVKAHTTRTPKITIPAPSALYGRTGRAAVSEKAYPSLDQFFDELGAAYAKGVRAFADAGCRYLQLDEVFIAMLCDPNYSEDAAGPRRRSAEARRALRRPDQRRDGGHSFRHDHHHASVPRQLPLDLHGSRRLRPGCRHPVRPHQGARLFHGVRHRSRRRASSRCGACARARRWCSAW